MPSYYGVNFPFQNSKRGDYVKLTENAQQEIRSNLVHLVLTRKGSRFFLPDFGTRLYEFIFEQLDNDTFSNIEADIRDACAKYIPNLDIQSITIKSGSEVDTDVNLNDDLDDRIFRTNTASTIEYTAQVKIDYTIKDSSVFQSHDFVIINI